MFLSLRSYTIAFLLPHKSVFMNRFNFYLSSFTDFGLVEKWYQDTRFIYNLDNKMYMYDQNEKVTLTLSKLILPFILLAIGVITSLMLFIIEMNF